jgi:hypothetical protein
MAENVTMKPLQNDLIEASTVTFMSSTSLKDPTTVRFGMASISIGTSIYVFGGCNASHFHDGDLYQIETDPAKLTKMQ